jgi:hypothetical protein
MLWEVLFCYLLTFDFFHCTANRSGTGSSQLIADNRSIAFVTYRFFVSSENLGVVLPACPHNTRAPKHSGPQSPYVLGTKDKH